jgi:hypothetical protein
MFGWITLISNIIVAIVQALKFWKSKDSGDCKKDV